MRRQSPYCLLGGLVLATAAPALIGNTSLSGLTAGTEIVEQLGDGTPVIPLHVNTVEQLVDGIPVAPVLIDRTHVVEAPHQVAMQLDDGTPVGPAHLAEQLEGDTPVVSHARRSQPVHHLEDGTAILPAEFERPQQLEDGTAVAPESTPLPKHTEPAESFIMHLPDGSPALGPVWFGQDATNDKGADKRSDIQDNQQKSDETLEDKANLSRPDPNVSAEEEKHNNDENDVLIDTKNATFESEHDPAIEPGFKLPEVFEDNYDGYLDIRVAEKREKLVTIRYHKLVKAAKKMKSMEDRLNLAIWVDRTAIRDPQTLWPLHDIGPHWGKQVDMSVKIATHVGKAALNKAKEEKKHWRYLWKHSMPTSDEATTYGLKQCDSNVATLAFLVERSQRTLEQYLPRLELARNYTADARTVQDASLKLIEYIKAKAKVGLCIGDARNDIDAKISSRRVKEAIQRWKELEPSKHRADIIKERWERERQEAKRKIEELTAQIEKALVQLDVVVGDSDQPHRLLPDDGLAGKVQGLQGELDDIKWLSDPGSWKRSLDKRYRDDLRIKC